MDRGAWQSTFHRVTKNWTQLSMHTHIHTHTHTHDIYYVKGSAGQNRQHAMIDG